MSGTGSDHHSKLPGLQIAPHRLQESPWGKRETKKWEMWQRDPPLADWYPKGSVSRWELILVSVLCAASRAPVVSVQS